MNKTNLFTILKKWKHIIPYRGRDVINKSLGFKSEIPQVVEYKLKVSADYGLEGKSLFFFSDMHCQNDQPDKYFPELIDKIRPDWIIFGGDLVTYACFIDDAFLWLDKTFANFAEIPKIAVPGNWDRRRKSWFPQKIWYEKYKKAGFDLLVNEKLNLNGIHFYGLDEPRVGSPVFEQGSSSTGCFNCIVSHCIEPIVDNLTLSGLPGNNLILCGHTHGGQIRIPFFGAVFTSSKYWKLFEYGQYRHQVSNIDMIISSGMGNSRIPLRIFCPPEVVVVRFVNE